MSNTDAKSKLTIGFLTVVEHPQYGLFGGYLLLNSAGRPLEFHCTAPIKPNRAQEILYGPTLQPFLYGEQIGRTLINHGETRPLVVCVDCEPAMAVREHVSLPVVLVLPPEGESTTPVDGIKGDSPIFADHGFAAVPAKIGTVPVLRLDPPHHGPRMATFALGRNRLALPEREQEDRRRIAESLGDLVESFDLTEPFQRIRDAIEEAQQAVR